MSAMSGMNPSAVQGVARELQGQAQQLSAIRGRIDALVDDAVRHWAGPDARRFQSQWNSSNRSQMVNVATTLTQVAETLAREAQQQLDVSAARSDPTGPTGTPPVPSTAGPMPTADPTATTADGDYGVGVPSKPTMAWDEDFVYNSASATFDDFTSAAKWQATMDGAGLIRWDLDDGLDMYRHYWDNDGKPVEFDYEEAAREDGAIAYNINQEVIRAQVAAAELMASGQTDFSFTSLETHSSDRYPETENWQKAIGGYQQWSSADVTVVNGVATMTVTVHAEDHYNFNRGQGDIASGAPDDENGRFTEIGWCKPFDSSGSVVRIVTWPVGATISDDDITKPDPQR